MHLKNETGVTFSMCLFYVSRSHVLIAVKFRVLETKICKDKRHSCPCAHPEKIDLGEWGYSFGHS